MALVFCVGALLFGFVSLVTGHGRLIDPPSRSSMWRYGFSTSPNYNDHELYCGGFSRQWKVNGGKCGICGDAWDEPTPRANEAGGKYGNGVIVRKYQSNSVVRLRVELTANHMGYFEFRLCPNNNVKKVAKQSCLDKYLLEKADETGPRFYPGPGNKVFESMYRLPKGLTCTQCVLQWKYVAGNNWGTCKNGTGMVGCGPQEQFRACADVAITDEDGYADDTKFYDANDVLNDEIGGKESFINSESTGSIYLGIIIAVMSLVMALIFFLVMFLWYYRGKECIKAFLKEKNIMNSKDKEKGELFYAVSPVNRPPMPPPRTKRRDSTPSYSAPAVLSISQPTNVTVNGVAITS